MEEHPLCCPGWLGQRTARPGSRGLGDPNVDALRFDSGSKYRLLPGVFSARPICSVLSHAAHEPVSQELGFLWRRSVARHGCPPLRRHILMRYCRTLSRAPRLRASADRFVVPDERFASFGFAQTLAEHRVIGLHGQSGIGKSAFVIYLAHQCASRTSAHPLLCSLVPVLLDLSVAGGMKPEDMFRTAMQKYGDDRRRAHRRTAGLRWVPVPV